MPFKTEKDAGYFSFCFLDYEDSVFIAKKMIQAMGKYTNLKEKSHFSYH